MTFTLLLTPHLALLFGKSVYLLRFLHCPRSIKLFHQLALHHFRLGRLICKRNNRFHQKWIEFQLAVYYFVLFSRFSYSETWAYYYLTTIITIDFNKYKHTRLGLYTISWWMVRWIQRPNVLLFWAPIQSTWTSFLHWSWLGFSVNHNSAAASLHPFYLLVWCLWVPSPTGKFNESWSFLTKL